MKDATLRDIGAKKNILAPVGVNKLLGGLYLINTNKIKNASNNKVILNMAENYDDSFRLYPLDNFTYKEVFLAILTGEPVFKHFRNFSFFNSWVIEKSKIKTPYLLICYNPTKYLIVGTIITILIALVYLFIVIFNFFLAKKS